MKLLFIISSLLILSTNAFTQKIDTARLNRLINHIESNSQDIGAISIFKEGREVYQKEFGQQAIPKLKWNSHTKYHTGSITKVFTAVLIWKLIENGKLSLNDKLAEFYPQIPNAQKITIKHLLEHSSGIKRDYGLRADKKNWLVNELVPDKEIIDEITRQGVEFEPGDSVSYSNSGYYLLKNIAERKYSKPYGQLIKKYIIKPNGLKDFASADMNPQNIFSSYAYNHLEHDWKEKPDYEYRNIIGIGDIATTPAQLNKFFYRLFKGKIVSTATLQQMLPTADEEFGRNLAAVNFYKKTFYGHAGDTRGSHSLAIYDIANNTGIAITLNGVRYPHNNFYIDILKAVYSNTDSLPYFASAAEMETYTGVYYNEAHQLKLRIYIDEQYGLLCEEIAEEISYPLWPYEKNKVRFDKFGIKMSFRENEMLLEQDGVNITLKKLEDR